MFGKKQDPYASSVFTNQYEMPQASYPELPAPAEGEDEETIDYWSVEAYRQGWHGRAGEVRAARAIKAGMCPLGTKNTQMKDWW
jgi:hypothetical protein